MQARFLLGPAGSGKTCRCLGEIRAALRSSPDGPPLILLAPKQATFQLERQLLAGGDIAGYTRLHIFSFDKLARFLFEALHRAPPALLSGEGRVMVLRALLRRHERDLKLFGRSARRPGLAQELSALLAEFQQHRFTPARLRALATGQNLSRELRDKLHDLALLHEEYSRWLAEHQLQDVDCLLEAATAALDQSKIKNSKLKIENLWLDGFAEMTPQEIALLTAVLPHCERATLAFCLETEPTPTASWLSIWSAIGKTFQQCRAQIANLPDCEVKTEILPREPGQNRFAENSPLAELEQGWSLPVSAPERRAPSRSEAEPTGTAPGAPADTIRIVACANPEAEAACAAREILKFVRSPAGHRFRDCAVLVRQLDRYHQPLARIFRRYEIPFFLDRREAVTHHPLAELTRSALRTVSFDWQPDDWFAALKAGFSPVIETEIDQLENAALEFGWRGRKWREPLPDANSERLRQIIFPPFEAFSARLVRKNFQPHGGQLADALRELWNDLKVEPTLECWAAEMEPAARERRPPGRRDQASDELAGPEAGAPGFASRAASVQATVWEQMNAWLDNLARAFPREALPLRDWLPILEAGLAGLTVGVIPPALDQVLIGAIDRARNPDLKCCLVLGANESVFPAAPAAPVVLTNADRDELEIQNASLGPNRLDQVSRERYLGYIACTRASERLVLTFARQDAGSQALNPSPFIAQIQKIFPALTVEEFAGAQDWREAEHPSELAEKLVELATPFHEPPGSAGVSPASFDFPLPTGRRDAGAPGKFVPPVSSGFHRRDAGATSPVQGEISPKSSSRFEPMNRSAPVLGHCEVIGARAVVHPDAAGLADIAAPEDGRTPPAVQGEDDSSIFDQLLEIPALKSLVEKLAQLREPAETENLSPALAEQLYGPVLKSSVSRLEEFAECPFKFFVRSGLRANERKVFELDARERGNFQHEVLKTFHETVTAAGRRWRDLTPAEARDRIGQIADALLEHFRDGLFRDSAETLFAARSMRSALQDFVEVIVGWMRGQYDFDPAAAELGFGGRDDAAPAWELDLGGGHRLALQGRIDRVDLWRDPAGDTALAVVTDYKSGGKKLDPLLVAHGVQLQLLAYLGALRHWKHPGEIFGAGKIVPAGAFYVHLRGEFKSGGSRAEVLGDHEAKRLAYRHTGRFDASALRKLDRRAEVSKGDQFNYRLNQDGGLPANAVEAIPCKEFTGLLDQVEEQLRVLGQQVFAGTAAVDPYRKGKATPCAYCDYRAVCRIDEWTHPWRVLRATEKAPATSSPA